MSPRPDYPSFIPRAPWYGGDLQTVRNLVRGPVLPLPADVKPERLLLPLPDGDRMAARLVLPAPGAAERPDAPLVVLVHGLAGSEDSSYIATSTAHLIEDGWPVLQLNVRGAGPSRPTCAQQYHAGRTEDFRDALAALPEDLLANGVVAVGFSLGGNMLLKYAAEYGVLRGLVAVSAPIDLAAASRRFHEPRNRVYHASMLGWMKREALAPGAALTDEERELIPRLRTVLEFDDRIVAPRNGFAGAGDYYAKTHARQFLGAIRVPTLVLHARDDPWIPSDAYTRYDWSDNPHLTFRLAPGGGHVGFHGRELRLPWHDRCLRVFLESL